MRNACAPLYIVASRGFRVKWSASVSGVKIIRERYESGRVSREFINIEEIAGVDKRLYIDCASDKRGWFI